MDVIAGEVFHYVHLIALLDDDEKFKGGSKLLRII